MSERSREEKLEILSKAGMMLRKELQKSQDKFGKDIEMLGYLCPIGAIKKYDEIIESLKKD